MPNQQDLTLPHRSCAGQGMIQHLQRTVVSALTAPALTIVDVNVDLCLHRLVGSADLYRPFRILSLTYLSVMVVLVCVVLSLIHTSLEWGTHVSSALLGSNHHLPNDMKAVLADPGAHLHLPMIAEVHDAWKQIVSSSPHLRLITQAAVAGAFKPAALDRVDDVQDLTEEDIDWEALYDRKWRLTYMRGLEHAAMEEARVANEAFMGQPELMEAALRVDMAPLVSVDVGRGAWLWQW